VQPSNSSHVMRGNPLGSLRAPLVRSETGQETVIRMYDSDSSNSSSQGHSIDERYNSSSSSDDADDAARARIAEPRRIAVRRRRSADSGRPRRNVNSSRVVGRAQRLVAAADDDELRDSPLGIEVDEGTSDEDVPLGGQHQMQRGNKSRVPPLMAQEPQDSGGGASSEDESIIVVADDEDGLDGEEEFGMGELTAPTRRASSSGRRAVALPGVLPVDRTRGSLDPHDDAAKTPRAMSSTEPAPAMGRNERRRGSHDALNAIRGIAAASPTTGSAPALRVPPIQGTGSSFTPQEESSEGGQEAGSGRASSAGEVYAEDRVAPPEDSQRPAPEDEDYDPLYDFGGSPSVAFASGRPQAAAAAPATRVEYRPNSATRAAERPTARPGHERSRRSASPLLPAVNGSSSVEPPQPAAQSQTQTGGSHLS